MRRNPAFAVTAMLTLALGIGANTAIFTVVRTVLLKPLDFRDPDRLVRISMDDARHHVKDVGFNQLRYEQIQAAAHSFSDLGAFFIAREDMTLSGTGEPESIKVGRVSANFLQILGIQPALGRGFVPEEDRPGGPAVMMISSELWQRRFGGDPLIAGKTATLSSTPYTIVGVLPPNFQFPAAGLEAWVTRPSEFSALPPQQWRTTTILVGLARLKPNVSLEQARAEMEVLNRQYALASRTDTTATVQVALVRDQLVANVRIMLWVLFGAVGFVLLIACANVASLLLARATSRSREFAIRGALGAARSRLIGQLLAESLSLAIGGGALGVAVAGLGLKTISQLSALNLPRSKDIHVDGVVLGFTVAISIATGVLFGLVPSLHASRPDVADALRASGEGASRTVDRRGPLGLSVRSMLVVGQVALSIMLLIGAALLLESFARLHGVDPGFQPANLLTMQIALPTTRYAGQKQRAFFEELERRIEAIPGVRSVTVMRTLPMSARYSTALAVAEQPPIDFRNRPQGQLQTITPGYFHTLGIPMRRGREFTAHDQPESGPVPLIINERLARLFWPTYPRGQDPIGQHLLVGNWAQGAQGLAIAGIVADVRERGLDVDAMAEVYFPLAATPLQTGAVAIRTVGDPHRIVNSVRAQVLGIDRDQAISNVRTMDEIIDASIGQRRLTLVLLGIFAGLALLLAVVGIYGVIAYSVVQRKKELGIRRALGAQRSDILRLVLQQGMVLVVCGIAIGIGGAIVLTRVLKGLLFNVSATDPLTFVGIALLFIAVSLAACYLPALRATRIDPMTALR